MLICTVESLVPSTWMNPVMLRTSSVRLPPAAKARVRVMVDSSTTSYRDERCACAVPLFTAGDTAMSAVAKVARVRTAMPHWMAQRLTWLEAVESGYGVLRPLRRTTIRPGSGAADAARDSQAAQKVEGGRHGARGGDPGGAFSRDPAPGARGRSRARRPGALNAPLDRFIVFVRDNRVRSFHNASA